MTKIIFDCVVLNSDSSKIITAFSVNFISDIVGVVKPLTLIFAFSVNVDSVSVDPMSLLIPGKEVELPVGQVQFQVVVFFPF